MNERRKKWITQSTKLRATEKDAFEEMCWALGETPSSVLRGMILSSIENMEIPQPPGPNVASEYSPLENLLDKL